ncbi:hypothetical protein PsYK624_136970 [Phanerochaete sordida]|uniref:F-box domain-containing protein n=1 Tax=Phanerochaete sordida TaxID=48140 RepID=A0A9P3GM14_9APHY|nr:hypothetical protein PsYK624_136970 [Phanerochaete sordida]
MDVVWRRLPTVDHLIRVLPENTRGRKLERQLTIVKAPSRADWQRFDFYARRVQELEYWLEVDDCGDVGPEVDWDSVIRHYPGDHLLPNLRVFRSDQGFMHEFYSLAIRSPVRLLYLDYMWLDGEVSLAGNLEQCADTLQTLTIMTVGWEPSPISDSISRAISRCSALISLYVDSLLPETIRHLSQLPSLTSLHFALERGELYATKLAFPALEDLGVTTQYKSPALLVSFLENLAAPNLRELEIDYDAEEATHVHGIPTLREKDFAHAMHVEAVLLAAATFPSLISIKYSFDIHPERSPSPPHICSSSVLRPLLALRNLETVKLSQVPLHLMAGDIDVVAQAWPKLRTLRLGDSVNQAYSSVEVQHLLPLVRFCPDLEDLGLPLLVPKGWTCATARPPFGESRSRLKALHVSNAGIEFSARAAAFLASVFPDAVLYGFSHSDGTVFRLRETKDAFVEVMKSELSRREGI